MRIFLCVVAFWALVDGECQFDSGDQSSRSVENLMKTWKIYGKILNSTHDQISYSIGICAPVNAKIAVEQTESKVITSLGALDHARLLQGDGWILLTYENGDQYENSCQNQTRKTMIMFVCGLNDTQPKILQEHTKNDTPCNFIFQIRVPELCESTEKKKSMSGGAIFLIVLFSLVTAYFVIGCLFLHIKRGARGLDRIPNLVLWQTLGHLAADGCNFCCRCQQNSRRSGYLIENDDPEIHVDDDILSP